MPLFEIVPAEVTAALHAAREHQRRDWPTLSPEQRARVWREDFEPLLAAMPDDLRARPLLRGSGFKL